MEASETSEQRATVGALGISKTAIPSTVKNATSVILPHPVRLEGDWSLPLLSHDVDGLRDASNGKNASKPTLELHGVDSAPPFCKAEVTTPVQLMCDMANAKPRSEAAKRLDHGSVLVHERDATGEAAVRRALSVL